MDDERRTKANTTLPSPDPTNKNQSSSTSTSCRTAELRWKWVENYCWKHGCMRSQNQCNDKWDNLLRDYKKVREYESRSVEGSRDFPSYWQMEKHERKERNLPTNLLSEVYEALNEVVHRRYQQQPPKLSSSQPSNTIIITPSTTTATTTSTPPPPLVSVAVPRPLPPPPPPPVPPPVETSDSSETEGSERILDSDTKHPRKVRKLGSSIVRSASVLAKTLLECEEKKEKRHQNLIQLEEKRLEIEETRTEVNKQGFAGLIAAVNNLSGAIQALVSNRQNNAT
ncbi:hypothetical protein BVC80_1659g17 [Macleaya cordata]|uniref:Myb/SANT-like DNA-binding domain-containing protein n=1 Tax=Macleaya cordata TaxID=56857 RepID=A0A200PZI7_MACCD|nr:hypothetical protein BVC80_1659g17 [Macleaya cordata]